MELRFVVLPVALLVLLPTASAWEVTVGVRDGALPIGLPPVTVQVAADGPAERVQASTPAGAASASPSAQPAAAPLPDLPPPPIVVDFPTRVLTDAVASAVGTLAPPRPASSDPPAAAPPAPPAPPARVRLDAAPPAPAASPLAPAAALAAVAAVSAAGPAAAVVGWERLRRLVPLAALYTRIAKERLLDHGGRERLLDLVRASPGIALADAARLAGLRRNTAVYHLSRLEKEGLVSSLRKGRARLYFAPGGLDQRAHADALAALRHPVTLDIAQEVGEKPGLDQQSLCARFGIAPSLAHWHANRLVESGVVTAQRDGRRVRYYPGAAFDVVRTRAA